MLTFITRFLSRRLALRVLPASFLVAMFGLTACSASPDSLDVPMAFRPERVVLGQNEPVPPSPGLQLHIPPVIDERADREKIGENTESAKMGARPIRSTGTPPADFVHDVFVQEFGRVGYTPISGAAGANRTLTLRLTKFFTLESTQYSGMVSMIAELRDQSGGVLWQGPISGSSTRFGRSMSVENYQETFSDATLLAVKSLLNTRTFQDAITVR